VHGWCGHAGHGRSSPSHRQLGDGRPRTGAGGQNCDGACCQGPYRDTPAPARGPASTTATRRSTDRTQGTAGQVGNGSGRGPQQHAPILTGRKVPAAADRGPEPGVQGLDPKVARSGPSSTPGEGLRGHGVLWLIRESEQFEGAVPETGRECVVGGMRPRMALVDRGRIDSRHDSLGVASESSQLLG
jgi:hypothetical protein